MSITTSLFATSRFSERNTQKRIGLLELLYLSMALIAMAPTLHWIQANYINILVKMFIILGYTDRYMDIN